MGSLEAELFPTLCQQHDRVNMFTRSKYGEFERRLDYVDRQTRLLIGYQKEISPQPVQHTRRYEKLAQEAERVGEDIQSLSRYVTTQKQAFRKILKKYRRWTASSSLEARMNNEAFNQPESVLNLDFMPLLDRLDAVKSSLAALPQSGRSAGEITVQQSPSSSTAPLQKPRSSPSRLHDGFLHSSPLEFDAAFTAVPLGMAGGRATYWVHKDNLEEVTVLIRRYMRDRKGATPPFGSRRSSITSLPTRRRDSAASMFPRDRTHISMFDNMQRFIKAHGAVTVGQAEDMVGSVSSMLAMRILWGNEPEAVVVTSDLSPSVTPSQQSMEIVHIKTKDLAKLFQSEAALPPKSSKGSKKQSASTATLQVYRDWLIQHRDIKPLAEVECTRSRFAGINNTSEVGTWALMDMDITMSPIDQGTIGKGSCYDSAHNELFPHTVLEVRWEFSRTPEIVRSLNSTHLVERIRGFSMEAHAISAICRSTNTSSPMWQPLLERDIRKVPPLQTRPGRRRSTLKAASSEPSSTEDPSTSVFSAASGIQSSATSPSVSRRSMSPVTPLTSNQKAPETIHPPKRRPLRRKSGHERQATQRYWNEFDDGEEMREDQVYAIYVNPEEDSSFPGVETVSKAFSEMYQSLGRTKRRIVSWLPLRSRELDHDADVEEGVRRPLLGIRRRDTDPDNEDSSDTDASISPARTSKKGRSTLDPVTSDPHITPLLSLLPNTRRQRIRSSSETALFRTYLGCYATAFILLIMSATLEFSGRQKVKVQVNAGIIVGVIAALLLALVGISLIVSGEKKLSWVDRSLGTGAFLVVCAWSGWLLAVVGGTLSG